jgi:hypothetical protein
MTSRAFKYREFSTEGVEARWVGANTATPPQLVRTDDRCLGVAVSLVLQVAALGQMRQSGSVWPGVVVSFASPEVGNSVHP